MNLPHLEPIRFANDIIYTADDLTKVKCTFPFQPTLPMLIEAAAQSCAAFSKDDTPKIGFLILVKDVILLQNIVDLSCIVSLKQTFVFGEQLEIYFEIFSDDEQTLYSTGSLMIMLQ